VRPALQAAAAAVDDAHPCTRQPAEVSDLARSLAVSSPTVAGDLDVLEATFHDSTSPAVRRERPEAADEESKLYVRDTGLLHHLAGLRQPSELAAWPRREHSFEGLVIENWRRGPAVRSSSPICSLAHAGGAEVDLLIADGRRIIPVEVKLGAAVDGRSLHGLRQCMAISRCGAASWCTPELSGAPSTPDRFSSVGRRCSRARSSVGRQRAERARDHVQGAAHASEAIGRAAVTPKSPEPILASCRGTAVRRSKVTRRPRCRSATLTR